MISSNAGNDPDASRMATLRELLATGKPVKMRRAIGELVLIPDDGTALALAARSESEVEVSSETLLRLWPRAADPDGFCAALLAPALVREGRTSIRLRRMTSLTGLRHLTTLHGLHIHRCKEITDLTEVAALTGLTDLGLNGCAGIEDLTPISGLTELTRLGLHRCRAVQDTAPLLALRKLRELDLSMTRVRSADGFTTAFPALETLSLHGCRSFMDASQLSGLTRLTHLDLGWTGIRDLTGLRDVPAMTRLDLRSCSRLNDLAGIDAMSGLTELILQDCPRLETLRGLAPHPRLDQLEIKNCSRLVDLSGMSPLTRLKRLTVRRCFGAYRVPALLAALVVSFGMSMNAMLLRNGFPGLPDQDPGWWTLLWMAPWAALSLLAAAWPPEASRPWPMFTRRCRAAHEGTGRREPGDRLQGVQRGVPATRLAGVHCRCERPSVTGRADRPYGTWGSRPTRQRHRGLGCEPRQRLRGRGLRRHATRRQRPIEVVARSTSVLSGAHDGRGRPSRSANSLTGNRYALVARGDGRWLPRLLSKEQP
ncbi:hypothetical protein OHU07_41175 [Streptomyces phaeochromogenes]